MTIAIKQKNIPASPAGGPKLRFPGFSGEWEEKRLGDFLISELRRVSKPSRPYLAIGIRSHFKGTFQKPNADPKAIAMDELFEIKHKDFIVNITFAWEGALAIAKKEDEGGLVSHRFPTYVFNTDITSPEYFRYVFPCERMKYLLGVVSPGGAGRNRVLDKKDFLKLKINLPSLTEQQKIVGFLTAVDEWIENLQEQKESLDKYKKGIMQKIFSQEIRFKDEDGNDFQEWGEKKLGEIATFLKGSGICKEDIIENGANKCIRYGELYTKYKEIIKEVLSCTNRSKRNAVLSEKNDILMPTSDVTPRGLATASALNEGGIILGGDILVIRSNKILNNFFSYYVRANRKDIMRLVSGVTVYHVYGSDLKKLKIKLPSFEEQQKIAEFLSSIDILIESKQQQITQAEKWKKGLMQGLFV